MAVLDQCQPLSVVLQGRSWVQVTHTDLHRGTARQVGDSLQSPLLHTGSSSVSLRLLLFCLIYEEIKNNKFGSEASNNNNETPRQTSRCYTVVRTC